jgi:hypothetical protein
MVLCMRRSFSEGVFMIRQIHPMVPGLFLIGILFIAAGIFFNQKQNTAVTPSSLLVLSPSPYVSRAQEQEPAVAAWEVYTNEKYNFTLNVPTGWNRQEYENGNTAGGTVIAFSPMTLPCKTCTYVHEGYFSIRLYNQQTDPTFYAAFQQRLKAMNNSKEYLPIQLDGKKGVMFGSTVAVENEGWVYELSLDKENGTIPALNSQYFQKFASSLKFTYLIFDN